jgi:predicted RNA-binding protein with PIN domain
MPYKLILDGNNIINRWTSCAKIRDFEGKKSELIRLMSDYKDRTGEEVCIVFDAKDSYNIKREIQEVRGIKVIHSARGEIADEAIKDMVFRSKERRNLIVVTSDNEIKIALSSTSVLVYSAERLEEEVLYEE